MGPFFRRTENGALLTTIANRTYFTLVYFGRSRLYFIAVSACLCLSLFLLPHLRSNASFDSSCFSNAAVPQPDSHQALLVNETNISKSKYAFATYLSSNENEGHYFLATRLLTYQLLHAPETRCSTPIPFLVLVPPDVSQDNRERLQRDGATVVEVQPVTADWIVTDNHNWDDVLTKFRLFEMTEFERIVFLDGDTVLNSPLDGVFDDPAVVLHQTLDNSAAVRDDEAPQPLSYVFAGTPEMSREHHYPPESQAKGDYMNDDYLNAGFFVLRPDQILFDYYMSVLHIPGRYESQFPEQNLMNYAHRRDGNMPWIAMAHTWNIHYPTITDLEMGCRSMHEKWWAPVDERLKPHLEKWRWRMEGFFEGRDSLSRLNV